MGCSWLYSFRSRSELSAAERDTVAASRLKCHINGDLGHGASVMRDIAFIVYPGYSVMALAVATTFEVANFEATKLAGGEPPYELHFVSETGRKIKTSAGMTIESEAFTDMPFDTLVVG